MVDVQEPAPERRCPPGYEWSHPVNGKDNFELLQALQSTSFPSAMLKLEAPQFKATASAH